jgi:deoxyribonuclease IV
MTQTCGHDLLLGAHFSIAGGLHKAFGLAEAYGCNAIQIFTKNSTTWRERHLSSQEIDRFEAERKRTGIRMIAAHASYLINIAGPEQKKAALSAAALKQELIRCGQLGLPLLVLHPGAHMDDGISAGIQRIADRLNEIFMEVPENNTRLLLETTAGQGTGIGHRFEHFAAIMDKIVDPDRIGVCMDTCHIFGAGYDISTPHGYRETMREFADIIGMERLFLLHLNDSRRETGARVDRHAHIGEGEIGINAFKWIINDARFATIPKIIETPKIKNHQDGDRINLELLRNLRCD